MRETVAVVVLAGLLGAGCQGKPDASAPSAPPPAVASKPAATPAESAKPARKLRKPVRVAKAARTTKAASGAEKKAQAQDAAAGEPRSPAIGLDQTPPSSY